MALDQDSARVLLPCGRDADAVAEHAAAGKLDEHERQCPFCGEIVSGSAAVGTAARALAQDTDADPSPGLLPAVMNTVWSELRPGRRLALPSGAGTTFVTETAVISAITAELDLIGGLTVRRIRLAAPDDDAEGGMDDSGDAVGRVDAAAVMPSISLTASVRFPADVAALASTARAAVIRCTQDLFALAPLTVDIEIRDLQMPATAT